MKKYMIRGVLEMTVFTIGIIAFPRIRRASNIYSIKMLFDALTLLTTLVGCVGMGSLQKAYDLRKIQK